MPRILYGTAWKKERTADLVELAIQSGFRGLDTACQPKHYDEPGVGEGLARCFADGMSRESLYLQTKFTPLSGQDPDRLPYDPNAPLQGQVAQSIAASLRNLRTDYLDGLLLHAPLSEHTQTLAAWRAMEAHCTSGQVRRLGISNCYDLGRFQALWLDAAIKPSILQNRFYAETGHDLALRAFCREQGIIYQSFWTLTANPELLRHPVVADVAKLHDLTPAQAFFRCLSYEGIVPLTGTSSQKHMAEDLAIFDVEFAREEVTAVMGLLGPSKPE